MAKTKVSSSKKPVTQTRVVIPAWMNEVTPLSKALAMALFILLPFAAFWMGARMQRELMGGYPPFEVVVRQGCSAPMLYKRGSGDSTRYPGESGKQSPLY